MTSADPTPAAAATPDPVAAPAPAAPEAAAPAAAPAETAAEAPAPAAAADTPAAAAPASTPSLLETATASRPGDKPATTPDKPAAAGEPAAAPKDAKAGDKPATETAKDAKAGETPAAAPKPETAPAPPTPAPEPQARSYEPFKVPDGIALRGEEVKAFTGILDDAALAPQDRAQKLVDLYVADVERLQTQISQHQRDVWRQHNEKLIGELKADPDLGGNRQDTALGMAKSVIEQYGGTAEQQAELLRRMTHNGAGNDVFVVRLLNNVAAALGEGSPVPAGTPGPGRRSWRDKAYGGNGKASA